MPNTKPKINKIEYLVRRIELAKKKCKVNYFIHFGIPDELDELNEIRKFDVKMIKVFPEDIEHYGINYIENVVKKCSELGIDLIIHPEDPELLKFYSGIKLIEKHHEVRHWKAEISSILYFIKLALKYNIKIHFTHVTHPLVVDLINMFRGLVKVTCDVTIHHILLSYDECLDKVDHPCICKVNPPLRDKEVRLKLFRKFLNNEVDVIVSDHAPHTLQEKYCNDYDKCTPGFPNLEILSPILLTLWKKEILTLDQVINYYSINPCRIAKLNTNEIYIGNIANLVIIDTSKGFEINPEKFKSKAKYSPFTGFKTEVTIVSTIVNGEIKYIHDDYQFILK